MAANHKIPRVRDLMRVMERWAPAWTAESWDRAGLAAGDPEARVRPAWTALELEPSLLESALAAKVDLLLLHHPPIFHPLQNLRTDHPGVARLVRAAAGGLALFAAHTNLDVAPDGVNDALARRLGLTNLRPLVPARDDGLAKLTVFTPPEHREKLARALFAAGAGRLGSYNDCAFFAPGTGGFSAPADGKPFRGRPGRRESVSEERLEVLIPLSLADGALRALRRAHPYEEPAYDLYPLKQPPAGFGMGRVGEPSRPCSGRDFLARAARELGSPAPAVAGPLPDKLERAAVAGGSGGDMAAAAAAAGAQLLITGAARRPAAEEARALGLGQAAEGHYETEAVIVEPWSRRLQRELSDAGFSCDVKPWTGQPAPWRPVGTE